MKKNLIEKTPNFTIITSGGCAASCSFCTDPMNYKASDNYMSNLIDLILGNKIPVEFQQVSISGGEPTQSKDLNSILSLLKSSKRFKKVVMTTNGYKLLKFIPNMIGVVDYINISRHDIGYDNNVKIFKTDKIATDDDIISAIEELSKYNIPVTLNHVYTDDDTEKMSIDYVDRFVKYAKELGATDICFRYDQKNNSLEKTWFEDLFKDYKIIHEAGCPVCRSFSILYKGMVLKFKASFVEPSLTTNEVYELVYHVNGKLTTDWSGTVEFNLKDYLDTYNVQQPKNVFIPFYTIEDTFKFIDYSNKNISSILSNAKEYDLFEKYVVDLANYAKYNSIDDLTSKHINFITNMYKLIKLFKGNINDENIKVTENTNEKIYNSGSCGSNVEPHYSCGGGGGSCGSNKWYSSCGRGYLSCG